MNAYDSKLDTTLTEKDQTFVVGRNRTRIPYEFHESILLILWGWVMFIDYFRLYLSKKVMISFDVRNLLKYSSKVIIVAAILYTVYYLSKRRKKLKTDLGKSLLGVWASLFLSMVLVNQILHNVMHQVVFELQHSILMLFTAFSILLTGRLIRNNQIFFGGIFFVVLAFASSYLKFTDQLLLEAIGWLVAIVIPGHRLYSKQKSTLSKA